MAWGIRPPPSARPKLGHKVIVVGGPLGCRGDRRAPGAWGAGGRAPQRRRRRWRPTRPSPFAHLPHLPLAHPPLTRPTRCLGEGGKKEGVRTPEQEAIMRPLCPFAPPFPFSNPSHASPTRRATGQEEGGQASIAPFAPPIPSVSHIRFQGEDGKTLSNPLQAPPMPAPPVASPVASPTPRMPVPRPPCPCAPHPPPGQGRLAEDGQASIARPPHAVLPLPTPLPLSYHTIRMLIPDYRARTAR